jgi:hypothetical protein
MKTETAVPTIAQAELDFSKADSAVQPIEIVTRNESRENRLGRCGKNCGNCPCRKSCGRSRLLA